MSDHLILVDGSAYIWRAFHAIPPLSRRSDGLPINAVAGFCNTLWRFVSEMSVPPTHFAVVLDHPSSRTARQVIYPEYKKNRHEPPDDIKPQFSLCRKAICAFGIACVDVPGFEADDLIATYATEMAESGGTAVIVSGDKDFMQLVTDRRQLFDPFWKNKKGDVVGRWIDEPQVIEKWGVPPSLVCEVQALAGDVTDNIPGVPGIGVKTAAELIREHKTVQRVLEIAPFIKQKKRQQMLMTHSMDALISRELVELDTSVSDGLPPMDELTYFETDPHELVPFLKGAELFSLSRKVCDHYNIDIDIFTPEPAIAQKYAGTKWRPSEAA